MRLFVMLSSLALVACGGIGGGNPPPAAQTPPPSPTPSPPPATGGGDENRPDFADEFDAGTLDRDGWNVQAGDFWVNNEQQVYIDSDRTIRFANDIEGADGGVLVLRPEFEAGAERSSRRTADFVSGRINSQDKYDFTYGRAEARIKMTDHVGVWPAWWLLGNGQWPATGEIDVMEYVGQADWTAVALHGPGYSGDTPLVKRRYFPAGQDVTDWHVYAVEWTNQKVDFYVDDDLFYSVERAEVERYGNWAFDNPKHLILNFAVGGGYPQGVNGIDSPYPGLPQSTVDAIKRGEPAMYVDWVRVWETPGD